MEIKNKSKNKYNNICIKLLNYFKSDESKNVFKNAIEGENSPFYLIQQIPGVKELLYIPKLDDLRNATLLSLYFSKSPYLLNLLSQQEIKEYFKINGKALFKKNSEIKLNQLIEKLCKKIMENKCILYEKNDFREIQIIFINLINPYLIFFNMDSQFLTNYYQIFNYFREIDFCLKVTVLTFNNFLNLSKKDILDEIILSLAHSDMRFYFFYFYLKTFKKDNNFGKQINNLINESLKIKDFIVLVDQILYEKIKTIEPFIKSKSFKYSNIYQISFYLDEKKKEKGIKIIPFFYFLIIRFDDFQKYYENIVVLSFESGITFLVFLYIENEENTKIYKDKINFLIPTILIYSPEDILKYLAQKFDFYNPLSTSNLKDIMNLKTSKIPLEQNNEDIFKNGCFELAETFNTNLITKKHVFRFLEGIDYITEFTENVYNIYKEHNALDLFYRQNCLYFGWKLYPELYSFSICFIKRFIYMYCRDEDKSEHGFFKIINDDLRTRDPHKIKLFINILALINQAIEEKLLLSFKGKVYRATKLDENLILKLIPGNKMVNTTFWSTSKDFQVAERFMKVYPPRRNAYIICNALKNNIDIDLEKLNPYNEREVLFLPFNEFRIDKVFSEIKYGKKIFIIELTELENKYFVNYENMKIENVDNLGMNKLMNDFITNFAAEWKNQLGNHNIL